MFSKEIMKRLLDNGCEEILEKLTLIIPVFNLISRFVTGRSFYQTKNMLAQFKLAFVSYSNMWFCDHAKPEDLSKAAMCEIFHIPITSFYSLATDQNLSWENVLFEPMNRIEILCGISELSLAFSRLNPVVDVDYLSLASSVLSCSNDSLCVN